MRNKLMIFVCFLFLLRNILGLSDYRTLLSTTLLPTSLLHWSFAIRVHRALRPFGRRLRQIFNVFCIAHVVMLYIRAARRLLIGQHQDFWLNWVIGGADKYVGTYCAHGMWGRETTPMGGLLGTYLRPNNTSCLSPMTISGTYLRGTENFL